MHTFEMDTIGTRSDLDAWRLTARTFADGVARMLDKRRSGKVQVQASELERLASGTQVRGCLAPALFVHMACGAVAPRYAAAGRADVATAIAGQRDALSRAILGGSGNALASIPRWPLEARRRRHGAHATRHQYASDPDLHVCIADPQKRFHWNLLAWVFQQPDEFRYRWSPGAERKLEYVVDCWTRYAACAFTLADAAIGAEAFPLSGAPIEPPLSAA